MTSITLPLKKFPGQTRQVPTFFGGRPLVAPTILLLTTSFTLYLYYYLNYSSLLSYNLLGLLPYLWGAISIAGSIKKSNYAVEELIEADLKEANQIFDKVKNYFRSILMSNIAFTIIAIIILTYLLIVYRSLSLFIVGLSSITSIEITLNSILTRSNVKRMFAYLCFVIVSEAAFLLTTFRGLWTFDLVFLAGSSLGLFLCLHRIDGYDLRSFFEGVIN